MQVPVEKKEVEPEFPLGDEGTIKILHDLLRVTAPVIGYAICKLVLREVFHLSESVSTVVAIIYALIIGAALMLYT